MRWRFLVSPAADGPNNMAFDDALMRRAAETREAVLRVYAWSVPTISLGRNQHARDCYDPAEASRVGVRFVRRPTGGRALLHDREVTYSVTMPLENPRGARTAYHFINCVLLGALGRLGVQARRAAATVSLPPGIRPCFDVPAENEIELDGRKLIGSAQWRRDGALLQHGSILVRDDQAIISSLLKAPQAAPPRAATLAEALGWEPGVRDLAPALHESLVAEAHTDAEPLDVDVALQEQAARLRDFYADESWTWRR